MLIIYKYSIYFYLYIQYIIHMFLNIYFIYYIEYILIIYYI